MTSWNDANDPPSPFVAGQLWQVVERPISQCSIGYPFDVHFWGFPYNLDGVILEPLEYLIILGRVSYHYVKVYRVKNPAIGEMVCGDFCPERIRLIDTPGCPCL